MQKIKCIIIEDEPLAVKVLIDYIMQLPYLELMATFREALSAGNYLQQEKPDLVFLDIHLPKIKGLAFLRTLTNPPAVIVTTAYHQYALEGFELSVTDYLMKPISFSRFLAAVNKASKFIALPNGHAQPDEKTVASIFLTINRKKVRLVLDEILYIESRKEYVEIHTTNNTLVCKMGTSELEKLLPPGKFKRIHRSFIVSADKITAYSKENIEIRGKIIPIGKNFRKQFSI
jgi:two-component system, LytTR family, response regulator